MKIIIYLFDNYKRLEYVSDSNPKIYEVLKLKGAK